MSFPADGSHRGRLPRVGIYLYRGKGAGDAQPCQLEGPKGHSRRPVVWTGENLSCFINAIPVYAQWHRMLGARYAQVVRLLPRSDASRPQKGAFAATRSPPTHVVSTVFKLLLACSLLHHPIEMTTRPHHHVEVKAIAHRRLT